MEQNGLKERTILNDFIELKRDEQEVNLMPPLTWAYVGDLSLIHI